MGSRGFPEGLKKKRLFQVAAPEVAAGPAAALFLPRFARERRVVPLLPAVAAEMLLAANQLTRELNDYDWYTAALDFHWPQPGRRAARCEVVKRLARGTPCFLLAMDRTAGVAAAVEDVFARLPGLEEVGAGGVGS